MLKAATDDELMLMAKSRARPAFDALIRRHQKRAIAIAKWQTGDLELAFEVAQDAFVDLLEAVPRYQALGKFEAFLYRIVVNRCRRVIRNRWRWCLVGDTTLGEASSLEVTSLDVLLERERERRLNDAIPRLSRPLREVVALWIEGLTDKLIAETLGIPEATVRTRRFAAIARLRNCIFEGV